MACCVEKLISVAFKAKSKKRCKIGTTVVDFYSKNVFTKPQILEGRCFLIFFFQSKWVQNCFRVCISYVTF